MYDRKPKEENRSNKYTTSLSSQVGKQRVFELLFNAEDTLIKASNTLHGQGKQVDSSSQMMNQMHKDLNVTETLIDGLDKWFTKWNMQPEHYFEIHTRKEYPILYRKSPMEYYSPGTLVFTEGQVTVLNIKRVADVSILLKNLTSIVVNTPWNVLFVRSVIGEVDVLIDVSSAQVAYILKILQSNHGDKFQYEEDSHGSRQTICIGVSEISCIENLTLTAENETTCADEDIEYVSDMVGTMKSLALDINQEMTRQLDRYVKVK